VATILGSLRRLLFAPSLAEVGFDRRGFPVRAAATARRRLEAIPRAVVVGFEAGIEAGSHREIVWRLELVDAELRGFAYEGAVMALTIRDRVPLGRRGRTRDLLLGPARRHVFLAYIGIGFAMARLPRRLWSKVVPDLTGTPYYPALSWLAVDGYGFDRAYFDTRRWVDQQYVPPPYPWLGAPGYFRRAVDQGIGRALWFIHGARPPHVAAAVARFAGHRRADLWSGVGLAAAFAGGADADGLIQLRGAAGHHTPDAAQGAAFAAKARTFAGPVPAHTETAVRILSGLSTAEAAELVDTAVAAGGDPAAAPAYEKWRECVRNHFVQMYPRV
jgi:hypothetical protein